MCCADNGTYVVYLVNVGTAIFHVVMEIKVVIVMAHLFFRPGSRMHLCTHIQVCPC